EGLIPHEMNGGLNGKLKLRAPPKLYGLGWVEQCARQLEGPARQTEKLVPQPHEAVALGFETLKEEPMRSSTKSISEPARYCSETGSTSTRAPARSTTRSSGWEVGTRSNL